MIVHLCLYTSGREVSSRLADPCPQWAIELGIILFFKNNINKCDPWSSTDFRWHAITHPHSAIVDIYARKYRFCHFPPSLKTNWHLFRLLGHIGARLPRKVTNAASSLRAHKGNLALYTANTKCMEQKCSSYSCDYTWINHIYRF